VTTTLAAMLVTALLVGSLIGSVDLLYVASTRARDFLLVTSSDTPSEFLDDLRM